jgi:exopolysaccharide biosynthesis predicted pyruvyltransferase EpsI
MTALFKQAFDDLAEQIRMAAQGRPIVYIPNPGNIGDGLIRHATKKFLFDQKIAHFEINIGLRGGMLFLLPFLIARRYFFIYGGGGAWHGGCDFGYRACRFISKLGGPLLVLPTTIALAPTGVGALLYRRDEGISRSCAPQSRFCHDMALYLFACDGCLPAGARGIEQSTLVAFRTDNESAREQDLLPSGNLDVSLLGNHMTNAEALFEIIDRYDSVVTDRLHVAVAAMLRGKRVTLHPGNYAKISGVYHASLCKVPGAELVFED